MLVLDPADGEVLDRISLDLRPGERDEPHGVAVSPDGAHWYASVAHGEPTLWKFEADGDRLVGRVTLPGSGAARVGLDPEGRRAAVPDYWLGGLGKDGRVAIVRLHDLVVEAAPEVCPAPHDAGWSPDGTLVAVTCVLSDEIVVLDAAGLTPVARFPVSDEGPSPPGNPRARPMNLAWSPDGSTIYVTLMRAGRLAAFGVDGSPLWSVAVGDAPTQLAAGPDGTWIAVADRVGGSLAIVDTRTREVRALSLPEALHPHGVAVSPDGGRVFVTYEGTTRSAGGVVAVDLAAGAVVWRREAGVFTLGIAYRP